jgi:methyl-accepting chemotaxis protein
VSPIRFWGRLVTWLSGERVRRLAALAEEVAGHWPHLPGLEKQIRETVQEVEASVVDVCNGFEGMATRARESVEAASRLVGSGQGSGIETLLASARHTLGELGQQAERGHKISSQVIDRMKTMESSAAVIVRALAEIDRIAFGSKLVALNAKVEAAHFGEQGAAFGVVADEISSHARQSEEITDRLMGEMQQLRATVAETSSELEQMARMSVGTLEASRSELEHALVELTRTHTEMESTLESSVRQGHELADEISRSIMALQFQDRVAQRLGHVADELAEMRKTVHLPLELLTKETPVLGESRRKEVGERLDARYTMQAERAVQGSENPTETEPSEASEVGEVELF